MRNMKAALDFWVKIIIGVMLGLLVFGIFTNFLSYILSSSCMRETKNDLEPLVETNTLKGINALLGEDEFYLPFTARGSCVNRIVFTSGNGYSECEKICETDFGPRQDKDLSLEKNCIKKCGACYTKKNCIIVVSWRPSYWNYALPWKILETRARRSDTIEALPSYYGFVNCKGSKFHNCVLDVDKGKTKEYCLHFKKEGDTYTIDAIEINSRMECHN